MNQIAIKPKVLVRKAAKADKLEIANLIHFETHVHRHLGWRMPLDWLGTQPYYALEKDGRVIASLACPEDPQSVAWIRLFCVANRRIAAQDAWQQLWPKVLNDYKNHPVIFTAMPLNTWFERILLESGFEPAHHVEMLVWNPPLVYHPGKRDTIHIRKMKREDLEDVFRVDCEAFDEPIWRNSLDALKIAFVQAVYSTVAEDQTGIIAYQIGTRSPTGGHLARLAVSPKMQSRGVGGMLVHDLLTYFRHQGDTTVTVNTQTDNHASLALYKSFGFKSTGEVYPVYVLRM